MPFKSKAQQRFMWAKHPRMAKEWQSKTPNSGKSLPEHVKKALFIEKTAKILFEKISAAPTPPPQPVSTFPENPSQAWKSDSLSSAGFMSKSVNHPTWAQAKMDSTATQKLNSKSFPEAGMMMSKRESAAGWAAKDPALNETRRQWISGKARMLGEAGDKGRGFIADSTITPNTGRASYLWKGALGVQSGTVDAYRNSNAVVDSLRSWYPQTRGWLK